jgi:hypothetical protein
MKIFLLLVLKIFAGKSFAGLSSEEISRTNLSR